MHHFLSLCWHAALSTSPPQSHLSVELEQPPASLPGVNGEVGGFVDDAAQRLQSRPKTPDLRVSEREREGP